ncbi:diguanylate cyclase domain-containing protein [Chungangia koreensis]|uniref:Diguanylate cyclase domain-containing protein n=1 Tax=Chungangia koreensis TaxID=752657 RepID=A0ABV8X679_9LACT
MSALKDLLTIDRLKVEVLELLLENMTSVNTYEEWFTLFGPHFNRFFNIQQAEFLVFDKERFVPMRWNYSTEKKLNSVSLRDLKEKETEGEAAVLSLFHERGFVYADEVVVIKDDISGPIGVLLLKSTEQWRTFIALPESRRQFIALFSMIVGTVKQSVYRIKQERKYKNLYAVTELFHSTMDVEPILNGIIRSVKNTFPDFETELILSNDYGETLQGIVRNLHYTSERDSTLEAYVSGNMTTEQAPELNARLLNVPIRGRQAIYGILQLAAPYDYLFSNSQMNYIGMLAKTAGNALENAKLYQQSHQLISELQLINETSQKMNLNISLDEKLHYLLEQMDISFKPSQSGFILYDHEREGYNIIGLEDGFISFNGGRFIFYAEDHFKETDEPLFIADIKKQGYVDAEYRSMMAVPLLEHGKVIGFYLVLHREPYYFSFENFKLMQSMIQHSTLAITNSKLRERLQEMVDKDYLTKLYSRKYFDRYVQSSFEKDESGVLLIMDVDNFKTVNDRYGHLKGDEVLIQISERIHTACEEWNGIGVRWGGEEIGIYLPSCRIDVGTTFARQLLTDIPQLTNPSVTVSIGLTEWNQKNVLQTSEIFHQADLALYEAKNSGKNQMRIYGTTNSLQ